MASIICTLFEDHYHYGVAALTNSLQRQGYRGEIYAGYRGSLPSWTSKALENSSLLWPGIRTLQVAKELQLHFLPLVTNYHLTNYKPVFMLSLLNSVAKDAEAIVYFDPDIVIKCRWNFFEEWMKNGVALVHDITDNDMPYSHPIRLQWEKIIKKSNINIYRRIDSYINAGFCGLLRKNIEFLNCWNFFIAKAVAEYGMDPKKMTSFDKTYPLNFLDQDALNIATMCSNVEISEMGPSAMDLANGGWTMSHAIGSPKPWKKNFILSSLAGTPPSLADKAFWLNTRKPINLFSALHYKTKRISILIASFIGRFYHKS